MTTRFQHGILFTDQYQLTMSQVYYRLGLHERPALFDHYFRAYPNYGAHAAGYAVAAGMQPLLEWMDTARFGEGEIGALSTMKGRTGQPLFSSDFLGWLRKYGDLRNLTIRAIPEGRVVHHTVPMTIVEGPLVLAQILETPLLNMLNFSTLIATKAARVRESAGDGLFLEFGLRRAQGWGANLATRAALIGGADTSSNVGAALDMGVQPSGTHAHSLVQTAMALGMGELGAFEAYAEAYPDDTLLLVDTINTLESGVPNAIKVFEKLRRQGHKPVGIRLDSGDLAYLSIQSAKMLNSAGFPDVSIVLSNNLDELVIWQILTQIRAEAPRYGLEADAVIKRLVFGVGTHLVTSWGEPALGGVYKLVSLFDRDTWKPAIKLSENPQKTPTPGRKAAWRVYDSRGRASADVLTLDDEHPQQSEALNLYHPTDAGKQRTLTPADHTIEALYATVLDSGRRVVDVPDLAELRERRVRDLARLDPGVLRLVNPHIYHVSLSQRLWELKQNLIKEMRKS
ncbi:nicotinate phosphoribosyltransferase [Herpetosiphon giganteus]|uniref:nicotinate phosphoribosyltransferase n=1 Tax=Herpetosiphon giganteus TaxID=2029754 RepID=UPI001958302E|nr:nicotinate phosphoribosyltransferase [Herpetosiphon giganteus]MBM7844236.1 nicotinate phosphoribosyltransferase [Herpetosiphon giganteus]